MSLQSICSRLGLSALGRKAPTTADVAAGVGGLHVTENVSGNWHYHLSKPGTNATALCGARTMYTAVPLSAWGHKGHLNESYCAACAQAGAAELSAARASLQAGLAR